MEFLFGFAAAIAALLIFRSALFRVSKENTLPQIKYSQSHVHEIIKNHIPSSYFHPIRKNAQSQNHRNSTSTRVVFVENNAYWIRDNTLFVADYNDGIVDEDSTRKVDTMGMDGVELKKVISIVEALTEGQNNDRGYTGNKDI